MHSIIGAAVDGGAGGGSVSLDKNVQSWSPRPANDAKRAHLHSCAGCLPEDNAHSLIVSLGSLSSILVLPWGLSVEVGIAKSTCENLEVLPFPRTT